MFKFYGNCLLVENLDKSLSFYTKKLGLTVKTNNGGYVDFVEIPLGIFQKSEAIAMFPKEHMGHGGGVILAYQVKYLKKVCKELISKGVDVFEGPKETDWGQKVAYFKDPDDNIWEISEPFKEK